MATHTQFSVTLHHLAPGARAAGLDFPDVQLPTVSAPELVELLHSLSDVAGRLTIYEPSNPEIRIKTDRDVFVIRTRYRRLCFVGRETVLRGEEHSIAYIMGVISGIAEPVVPSATIKTVSASPMMPRGMAAPSVGVPDWLKIAAMLVLSAACLGGGVWLLLKPPRAPGPKFKYMSSSESSLLLAKAAGEYRTGIQEGDRRLIIGGDGTLRIAKFAKGQEIAEEFIRTARGATQAGHPSLATTDPYLMTIQDPNTIILYGQVFRRVSQ
jgi:hypothetical protein